MCVSGGTHTTDLTRTPPCWAGSRGRQQGQSQGGSVGSLYQKPHVITTMFQAVSSEYVDDRSLLAPAHQPQPIRTACQSGLCARTRDTLIIIIIILIWKTRMKV